MTVCLMILTFCLSVITALKSLIRVYEKRGPYRGGWA